MLEIEKGDSSYFAIPKKYRVWTEPAFEKYVYTPFLTDAKRFSLRIKLSVQTGSTHAYLIYILATVLVLMLYNKKVFGITESPRGENIHWVMTDEIGNIFRYKIRTPSYCNWPALCHAVAGNIVPDFPLINNSFNLSYAGNDL
ncbi:MAG: hypothetical protein ACOX4V_08440 [Anaerovoracaceae bacterium]